MQVPACACCGAGIRQGPGLCPWGGQILQAAGPQRQFSHPSLHGTCPPPLHTLPWQDLPPNLEQGQGMVQPMQLVGKELTWRIKEAARDWKPLIGN